MKTEFIIPSFIYLYDENIISEIDISSFVEFLQKYFPFSIIRFRKSFLNYWIPRSKWKGGNLTKIAFRLAQTRINQIEIQKVTTTIPLPEEVDFEQSFLLGNKRNPKRVIYDACRVIAIYSELFDREELNLDHCHLVLTDRLLGVWGKEERRYQIKGVVFGNPTLISISGILERLSQLKRFEEENEQNMGRTERGSCDKTEQLQEIVKGHMLQALFYYITGNPFCSNRNCCLFEDRSQEDIIHAQLKVESDLCPFHHQMIEDLLVKTSFQAF